VVVLLLVVHENNPGHTSCCTGLILVGVTQDKIRCRHKTS